jgi:hypothetical protein
MEMVSNIVKIKFTIFGKLLGMKSKADLIKVESRQNGVYLKLWTPGW